MTRWLRRAACWVLGHEFEPAMIFRSMGGIPAERCRFCELVRPNVAGRVVRW